MGLCLNQHDSTFFTMNFGSASRPSNKTTPFDSQDASMTRIPRHHLPPPPSTNHHHQQQFHSPPSSHFAPAVPSRYADVSSASSSTLPAHYGNEIQYTGGRPPNSNVRHPTSVQGQSPRSRSSRGRQMTAGDGSIASSNGVGGGKKRGTGAWTEAEDAKLFDLVRTFGTKNWVSVERAMEGRDKKQCRERWCNHVNPHINDAPFSEAESIFIIDCYVRHGRQWARMSRCAELHNRPDNAIKNHFNTNLRDHYAEICRQFNIPRRQPNDLLEIDEATYARVKGRITAPPASSMRGSKASRFVSSGSGRHDASGHPIGDPGHLGGGGGGGYSPGKVVHHIGAPSSAARPMDAYPYGDDRRIAHPSSYDPRHAPPSFLAPRHPAIESAARPGWHSYSPQHPAYDDRSATSPVHRFARPGQMTEVMQARSSHASLSPISSAAGYTDRDVAGSGGGSSSVDMGYAPERFYPSRQDSAAPLPPLSRTLSSARPDTYDRPRYSPSSTASSITANPPRALQLPPIGLSQISQAGSMPSTPLDDVTSPNRARSHSEIDAEHKSMLWSSMGSLHQGRRAGPPSLHPSGGAGGPDRTSSFSSIGPGKGPRYMPYARPGASEDDFGYLSRRKNSSGSSSSAEREAAAGIGPRIKPAGLPEPMSEDRSDYRRQIAASHPQDVGSSYYSFKTSPPSYQHTH